MSPSTSVGTLLDFVLPPAATKCPGAQQTMQATISYGPSHGFSSETLYVTFATHKYCKYANTKGDQMRHTIYR